MKVYTVFCVLLNSKREICWLRRNFGRKSYPNITGEDGWFPVFLFLFQEPLTFFTSYNVTEHKGVFRCLVFVYVPYRHHNFKIRLPPLLNQPLFPDFYEAVSYFNFSDSLWNFSKFIKIFGSINGCILSRVRVMKNKETPLGLKVDHSKRRWTSRKNRKEEWVQKNTT